MAEMGPWILTHIDVRDRVGDEHCQRCREPLRYVWVMEKQTEPKETCRIGSKCGPTLEMVSKELWDTTTAPFHRSLDHLLTLEKLSVCERDYADCRPKDYELGWAEQQRTRIAAGGLTRHEQRVLGHHISQAEKKWKRSLFQRYGHQQ